MKFLSMSTILRGIKEYVIMALAMLLYAFGWIACVIPYHCTSGGAGGFALVATGALQQLFGIEVQVGTMVFLVNGILMIIGGLVVGWNFGPKTIFCVAMIGMGMNFWEWLLYDSHIIENFYIFSDALKPVDQQNPLLPMILGGIFAGTGIAICFSQGGTTGGTDIVALIVQKFKNVNYGKVLIITDACIIGSSLLVGYELFAVIYGFIMTVVVGYTADALMSGNKQSSQIMIITQDYERMAEGISTVMRRGVTLIESQGWYTKEKGKIVMVVCRKREAPLILRFVKTIDPDAFITTGSVAGAYGKGFDALNKV